MKTDILLIFDIGKTNKKALLFDREMNIISVKEQQFEEITDDDGFACDDIAGIEDWILGTCKNILNDDRYNVKGINFTTYGATLVHTDSSDNRVTPVYNYLKPIPEGIVDTLYNAYGGEEEFCRITASPALGMLNSGLQILWLKASKRALFDKIRIIQHFPQYLSSIFTGKITSEHTSIGCHTALWDFDQMRYHDWLDDEGIRLPEPISVDTIYTASTILPGVPVGIGIHDSSSSLVPYFRYSEKPFILLSTGTWCISMNPYNHEPLTGEQLNNDCLAYMSMHQKPVKSSRFFLGHIHDVNVRRLNEHFNMREDAYKDVDLDENLLCSMLKEGGNNRAFFSMGLPEEHLDVKADLSKFVSFSETYHRLMVDLTGLAAESVKLVIPENDNTKYLYITGGFARNPIFVNLIATLLSEKCVYTSEVANSTSLGAALVIWKTMGYDHDPSIDLGMKHIEPLKLSL